MILTLFIINFTSKGIIWRGKVYPFRKSSLGANIFSRKDKSMDLSIRASWPKSQSDPVVLLFLLSSGARQNFFSEKLSALRQLSRGWVSLALFGEKITARQIKNDRIVNDEHGQGFKHTWLRFVCSFRFSEKFYSRKMAKLFDLFTVTRRSSRSELEGI